MNITRWQPFQEIERLQLNMNHLFDGLVSERDRLAFFPTAELQETADTIHLSLEVPGMDVKDLDVQVSAEAVSISGNRQEENKTQDKGVTRTEFRYGRFQRVIPLPTRIENTNVKADYKDGILKLTLPKAEEEQNKIVKVSLS
jgi:HSP20 family protein